MLSHLPRAEFAMTEFAGTEFEFATTAGLARDDDRAMAVGADHIWISAGFRTGPGDHAGRVRLP